jgi:hypothetical protein
MKRPTIDKSECPDWVVIVMFIFFVVTVVWFIFDPTGFIKSYWEIFQQAFDHCSQMPWCCYSICL